MPSSRAMRGACLLALVALVAGLSVTPQEGSVLRWDGGVSPTDAAPSTAVVPEVIPSKYPVDQVVASTEAPTSDFIPTDPTSCRSIQAGVGDSWCVATCTKAVSYTHLTLPTKA